MFKISRITCVIAISALAITPPLMAQEAPSELERELFELLNTPVTGASKREQRILDSPQAIEVLTGEDIRQMGIYHLQDALRLMTSIDIMEADHGYAIIGMRGVMQEGQPRTVQILIDGVPMYTPFVASNDLDNLPIPIDVIERIEVVRGPSSTLYGANAVVGVISITTRKQDKGFHGVGRINGADKKTGRGATRMEYQKSGFGILVGYQAFSFGNSDYATHMIGRPQTTLSFDGAENGPGHQSDSSHQYAIYARSEYQKRDTQLRFSYGSSQKSLHPSGLPPVVNMGNRFFKLDSLLASWRQSWATSFSTEVRLHRMVNKIGAGPSPILAIAMADPAFNGSHYWRDTTSDQVDIQANWAPMARLNLVFGADTRRLKFEKSLMVGIHEPLKESASGAFASVDWKIAPSHNVSLGFRAENESLGGSRLSPRFAYTWNPTSNSVLRLAYLTSSRSPQILEQRITLIVRVPTLPGLPVVYQTLPNPELKPEKTTNWEIGYRQQLGIITLDATVYQMKIKDIINNAITGIIQLPPPYDKLNRTDVIYQNIGSATNTGLEMAATFNIKRGWTAGLNLAYLDYTKDDNKDVSFTNPLGDKFSYAPKTKANAWTRMTMGKWNAYLGLQYVDKVDIQAIQAYGPSLYDKRDAYLQIHGNIGYELGSGLSLNAYVRNGAREYTPQGAAGPERPVFYLPMRREVGGTLSYRF